ncbi:hypothetical protein VTJ49DRAFT_6549 [Mycothermus thermophilus]|uniref:Ig-like domain-containing protein n=1 Tax=Humicola insolens TaxID=85995 RepID=A0ABR3VJX9_HUMIN
MAPLKRIFNLGLATVLSLHPVIEASPVVRQATPVCTDGGTIENLWLVEELQVAYTHDERVRPGTASWRITNTVSGAVEELSCNLRANYICELAGTPTDPSLQVWLQINLDVARITINQSLPCEDAIGPAFAIGTAELFVVCDENATEEDLTCQSDEASGPYYAEGSVTLSLPSGD